MHLLKQRLAVCLHRLSAKALIRKSGPHVLAGRRSQAGASWISPVTCTGNRAASKPTKGLSAPEMLLKLMLQKARIKECSFNLTWAAGAELENSTQISGSSDSTDPKTTLHAT